MHIKNNILCWFARFALLAFFAQNISLAQDTESLPLRIVKWSPSEQVAWLKSYLADGMPGGDELPMLVLNRSSIVLPVLEQEIEEILRSSAPQQLFSNPSADPQRVVTIACTMIEYAGDEQSLREAGKLMKIDEHRFGGMVNSALSHANRNSFIVAYKGFEIGDPQVDKRIVEWADKRLKLPEEYDRVRAMRSWAEAMVEKYDGAPTDSQWNVDPIVSRLDPVKKPALRDQMLPLAAEAAKRRSKN
jgi:hypothetical protein